MELLALRRFAEVAELGSVSRAAGRLRLSQPTLSRQIQALEAELGVPLFDRIGRTVTLTDAGHELLRRARGLLQEADALQARFSELASGSTGVLRIGATPQTLDSLVADVLVRYRRRHPHVDVELVEDGAASLLAQVERGTVHLAIATLPEGTPLAGRVLFPLGVLAVVPRHHRFAHRRTLEVSDLAAERLLLLRHGFLTRQLFDAACHIARVTPRIVLESGSPHSLLTLVERGHGIAVIPSTVRVLSRRHRLLAVRHGGRQLGVSMSAIWDPRRYVSPAVRLLIEEFYLFTRRQYPGRNLHLRDLTSMVAEASARVRRTSRPDALPSAGS